jgi:hypothetical protein
MLDEVTIIIPIVIKADKGNITKTSFLVKFTSLSIL